MRLSRQAGVDSFRPCKRPRVEPPFFDLSELGLGVEMQQVAGAAAVGGAEAGVGEGGGGVGGEGRGQGAFEPLGADAGQNAYQLGRLAQGVDVPMGRLAAAGVAAEAGVEAAQGAADVDVTSRFGTRRGRGGRRSARSPRLGGAAAGRCRAGRGGQRSRPSAVARGIVAQH